VAEDLKEKLPANMVTRVTMLPEGVVAKRFGYKDHTQVARLISHYLAIEE